MSPIGNPCRSDCNVDNGDVIDVDDSRTFSLHQDNFLMYQHANDWRRNNKPYARLLIRVDAVETTTMTTVTISDIAHPPSQEGQEGRVTRPSDGSHDRIPHGAVKGRRAR